MSAREVQEWRRLAWAIGADDCGTDEPVGEADPETLDWRAWAESTHGATARAFISIFDALATIRTAAAVVDAGHCDSSRPVSEDPYPDDCPNCGEPFERHSAMVRGPHEWACYYDAAHPTDDDYARDLVDDRLDYVGAES